MQRITAKFEENLKNWSADDLDVLNNALRRNCCLSIEALNELLPHKTDHQINTLFKMMKNHFPSYSYFNEAKSEEKPSEIPIEVCLQAVTLFCGEDLNFSSELSQILYNIGNSYGKPNKNEPDYRTIYHYLSAILSNKKPPSLNGLSAAVVLELMFIVAGAVGGELDSAQPDKFNEFLESEQFLCEKLGAFLLASQFHKTSKSLEDFLSETFKLPKIRGDNEDKDKQSVSKKVTLHSLNPLNIPKRLVDHMSSTIAHRIENEFQTDVKISAPPTFTTEYQSPGRKRGRPRKSNPPELIPSHPILLDEASVVPSFTIDSESNLASGLSRTASIFSINEGNDDVNSLSAKRNRPSSPDSCVSIGTSLSTDSRSVNPRSKKYVPVSDQAQDKKTSHSLNNSIRALIKTYNVKTGS